MFEYLASDVALSIVELWVTYAAYFSLKSAFVVSRMQFPQKCLLTLVQLQVFLCKVVSLEIFFRLCN